MKKNKQHPEDENTDRVLLAEKVDAILNGAMQEFLIHGYAATTMDRVTAAAGVSKTTVYSYFQDKERLFTALIEKMAQEGYQVVFNPQDTQFFVGEPSIVLRRLAVNIVEHIKYKQESLNLIRLIIGESGRFPLLAQVFLLNVDKPVFELLTQYFTDHPELQLSDPQAAARIFMGTLIHYKITQYMLHGQEILPLDRDRLIDNLVDLLTNHQTVKNQYSGTRHKSPRRKRNSTGKFQSDYEKEAKQLRSIRLTDTAWEKLAELAEQNQLTRSEMIERFARNDFSPSPE
ncbi:TetR/AcrR family transcriptional regulator [Cronbergia sp. UHCC 0137]|uniref:TetR/AcrR family transcriptional regulator n=1 Tax=Cronbergia sp. UHCC 0137 TaxID=3110239 RepID=UPI002B204828|nr:TetR/AcrR family transcriptional regulator [Cronbergia sp. UHCC 0137]MEA5619078.1 TetR/AcrR family transcriptional regulator [Cronbergia sp. UHCC 0137]